MRKLFITLVVMCMGINASVMAQHHSHEHEHKKSKEQGREKKRTVLQTTCPVMGGKIDKAAYVEKDGKRIYACCKGCVPAIEKDFAKYAANLEKAGVTVAKVQTVCPIMDGRKVDRKLYADHNGKRIYVCCKGCVEKVSEDPEKHIVELEKQGVMLETTPATVHGASVKQGDAVKAGGSESHQSHGGHGCR